MWTGEIASLEHGALPLLESRLNKVPHLLLLDHPSLLLVELGSPGRLVLSGNIAQCSQVVPDRVLSSSAIARVIGRVNVPFDA